ncbi:GGDEF domain-containing protein [Noviherbaspirillum pedocola]|uniref:diguanylate cyclase n=1 Tax=Noviherbaspirillum pedocola TaxID=2801341 RepID=A0A934W548_9BURK|nr:GGDEF domain-containing protein [Noviherbaspirillum pedocola]MBK4739241.1 GGDEF domain-containing protein [Noviherbaspirillum pedocola]
MGSIKKQEQDHLAAYRDRIIYPILIIGAICLAPLFLNSFIEKRFGGGFATLIVAVSFVVDALALRAGKRPPVPYPFLVLPMALAMGVSLATQGFYGALWAYPVAIACFFVLSQRMANLAAALLLVSGAVMVYRFVELGMALRFTASFGMTIGIANCILSVITRLQKELRDQAITDPLTGTYNRRHMDACLAKFAEHESDRAGTASLLLIDVDHFKRINDQLGHASGDHVLVEISNLIRNSIRKSDQLFRVGGEEFLLLLPGTRIEHSMVVAENIRAAIENAVWLDNYPPVTISIGVSQSQVNDLTQDWLKAADHALYQAKISGRNRVVCAAA